MTQQSALRLWRRGPFKVLFAHHREHEAHHVVVLMVLAAALSLIASIFVAGAAGYVAVASHLRHADWYWIPFAMAGAVAAQIGYTFAYREVAHVGRGVKLSALRAGAIVSAGFGMFIPRGGFAVDIEALEDLGVPPRRGARAGARARLARVRRARDRRPDLRDLPAPEPRARPARGHALVGDRRPAGTALALLAVRYRTWICRGWLKGILGPPLEAIAVVGQIVASPRRHGAAAFFGMALYWAGEVFVLWVCLAAFNGDTPSVAAVVVGYATGYALTRRTLPLAGAGAVEALLPFALVWVGYGLAPAVLAVFAYRIFNLWLPLGPAAFGLYHLQRRAPEGAEPLAADAEVVGDDDGVPPP